MLLSSFDQSLLWVAHRFGLLAFIGLGLLDSSVVPLPGSMDALAIVLATSKREWWWYYALLATTGAVVGGYANYRLARRGGKEALEKELGTKRAQKVYRYYERMGFWTVFLGGIAPPPVPTSAFVMAAGALQYSRNRFLVALTISRAIRFLIVTWVASRYGRQVFQFFSKYYEPALWTLIGIAVLGGLAGLGYYLRYREKKKKEKRETVVAENKVA